MSRKINLIGYSDEYFKNSDEIQIQADKLF